MTKVVWVFIILVTTSSIAGFCAVRLRPMQPEIRIAMNSWPGFAPLFLAAEKGMFQDEGVSVRFIELGTLSDARRVYEQGNADVVGCTLVELLLMNDSGIQANRSKAITIVDYSNGGDMLLAGPDIATTGDLRGKRIGLEPESLDAFCVALALQSAELGRGDVTLIPMSQCDMSTALVEGRVDAVQLYSPAADRLLETPGIHTLWDSADSPETILDVLAVRSGWCERFPERRELLQRVSDRAIRYAQEHPKESARIMARRCGQDQESWRQSTERVHVYGLSDPNVADSLSVRDVTNTLARTVDSLTQMKLLKGPPRFSPFAEHCLVSQRIGEVAP